jgi:SnoaL-like domain
MQVSTKGIDGSETNHYSEEEKALSLFYKAFNKRDIGLMSQSWLNTDECSMDNPMGGIRRGWEEISKGYKRIFDGPAKVYVEFYDFTIHKTGHMFFATGRERGYFKVDKTEVPLDIRTSRIFILLGTAWRQIHHHGSIDNPALLKAYQDALSQK